MLRVEGRNMEGTGGGPAEAPKHRVTENRQLCNDDRHNDAADERGDDRVRQHRLQVADTQQTQHQHQQTDGKAE